MVNFVATTRRWCDRCKNREMRETATPANVLYVKKDSRLEGKNCCKLGKKCAESTPGDRLNNKYLDYDLDDLPVEMPKTGEPKYDIRAINDYCKKHGIDLKKENGLSKEIVDQFIIGKYGND